MSTLAERLKLAMSAVPPDNKPVSAYALWHKSGVSQSHIGRLLKGQRASPKPHTLDRLARALGVRYEWLAQGDGAMRADSPESVLAGVTPLDLAIHLERDRVSEQVVSKVLRWAEKTPVDLTTYHWVAILRDVQRQLLEGVPASKVEMPEPDGDPPIVRIEIERKTG